MAYGTLLTNKQIEQAVQTGALTIRPYSRTRMKLAHYRLTPGLLAEPGELLRDGTRDHHVVHDFRRGSYNFDPAQYMIVEVAETVLLPEGLVGKFVPASTLVEQGFGLVAGKLDSDYGMIDGEEQRILLGIQNLLGKSNPFDPRRGIAHLEIYDCRATQRFDVKFSKAEKDDFRDRKLRKTADDGPNYHRDDPQDS